MPHMIASAFRYRWDMGPIAAPGGPAEEHMLQYRDVEKQDCDWCSKYQFAFTVDHLRLLNYITGRISWFMAPYGMIIPAVWILKHHVKGKCVDEYIYTQ